METITMFGVEHYNAVDNTSTYEIFSTLENAQKFCADKSKWNKKYFPLYIFKADFNTERIYQEDDEMWNYDDFSDTILKYYDFKIEINSTPQYCNQ